MKEQAYICHGGLGDLYIQLLKILNRKNDAKYDIHYYDELCTHEPDIRILFEKQDNLENFFAHKVPVTHEVLGEV